MLRRRDVLLLIGVVMVATGGALFFIPFHNEPLWDSSGCLVLCSFISEVRWQS